MSDREWLKSKRVHGDDLKPLTYYVSHADAIEYGERCAKAAKTTCKVVAVEHYTAISEWKLSCGHNTVTNVGYQPNNCEWCGAEVEQ